MSDWNKLFDRTAYNSIGCLEYTGPINQSGYGLLRWRGRSFLAHRMAYILCVGEIPNGLCVLHDCDNRLCLDPDHMWLGDNNDNNQDMVRKKRHQRKLSDNDKVIVLSMLAEGHTHLSIAKVFGLTREAITKIANRRQ